jgi:hypothetical protein
MSDELLTQAEVAAMLEEVARDQLARLYQLRTVHAYTLKKFGKAPALPADIDMIEQHLRAMISQKGGA